MTHKTVWRWIAVLLTVILVGPLAPQSWYSHVLAPFGISMPLIAQKSGHVLLFAALAIPVSRLLPNRGILVVLVLSLMGRAIEVLQFFTVDRHPSLVDLGYDDAGINFGMLVSALFSSYARRTGPGEQIER